MHRRILSLSFVGFLGIIIFNWGCTKIDTTNLGSDLIPAVDNVNTFADTFYVNATQNLFDDTTYVVNTDNHPLGHISNDPLYGKTTANIFFQLKPGAFPFSFGPKDSLTATGAGLDSVVLCLSYRFFWGDSTIPQQLQVSEITDLDFRDSIYKNWDVNSEPATAAVIGSKTVDIRRLADTIKYRNNRDYGVNQIRINLDPSYASRIFGSDSAASGPGNHAFHSDTLFRDNFRGLAVKALTGGNGLMYINLADTNTKLEVHYRIKNAGKIDTVYKSFVLNTKDTLSPTANSIFRDRSGSPSLTPLSTEIYLQAQPGISATLKVDSLTGYSNRIIHRAELIIEQIPYDFATDTLFPAPNFVYLDLKEPGTATPYKYKPIYHDLSPGVYYDPDYKTGPFYPTGGADYSYFGGYLRKRTGPLGVSISYYNFNITRYVQQMVTKQGTNYELRLFPAYRFHYPQYSAVYTGYNNNAAYGRIKVGNGTHPNYPMRVRIIYSKIK